MLSARDTVRLLAVVVSMLAAGCDGREPPVSHARTIAPEFRAVGPIPGVARAAPHRKNPHEGDAKALMEGRRLFVAMNCSGCHGGHAGGGMGPSLRDPVWVYGGNPADIYDSIASGRAYGMPAWGTLLPPDTIWMMTAYVSSLGTPEEPMPPR